MQIRVSATGRDLKDGEVALIEKDLDKIARRLDGRSEVYAVVRINDHNGGPEARVTLELEYGRNHLLAKADNTDVGQAVREAREEILRQINDRSRGGHSDFTKRR